MLKQLAIIFSLILFVGAIALAQDKPETQMQKESKVWNKICPVDGMPINAEAATVEFNDKVWGFCSNEHAAQFKQDPEALSGNISEDGAKYIGKTEGSEQ